MMNLMNQIKLPKKIITLKKEYNYFDFAILTRTNFQTQAIEEGLYQNNIPYLSNNSYKLHSAHPYS
jgi:superfamily I DNA/RNA helicase